MSRRKSRTFYPAVTFTVITVGLLGVFGATLRRFIPPPALNPLAKETDPFLLAGSRQAIPWNKLTRESLAKARREDKPIMLVIGDTASQAGQITDQYGFTDPEIAEFIRTSFVPIRVDATARPELAIAFDPIVRSLEAWDPTFQIWYLNSSGEVLGALLSRDPRRDGVTVNLPGSIRYFKGVASGRVKLPLTSALPGVGQKQQRDSLLNPSPTRPDYQTHSQFLAQAADPVSGSWPKNSFWRLNGSSARYLLRTGQTDFFRRALDPVVSSGMVDWVGGGFFYQARAPQWRDIDLNKVLEINGDMGSICAMAFRSTGEPLYRDLARQTFDCLVSEFNDDNLLQVYRRSDGLGLNRSQRSSFSPRSLLDLFEPDVRGRIQEVMDLDVAKNPQMLPRAQSPAYYRQNEPEFQELLAAIRGARTEVRQDFVKFHTAATSGEAVAHLLQISRLLADESRQDLAYLLFRNLQRFRVGTDDMVRKPDGQHASPPVLTDYLGFSDAALQAYLVGGDPADAIEGFQVLRRAIDLFESPTKGVLLFASPEGRRSLPPNAGVPEIVDRFTSSASATAIRLSFEYAAVLECLDSKLYQVDIQALREFSRASTLAFGEVANEYHRRFSGYFDAAFFAEQRTFVSVSGKGAVRVAERLLSKLPMHLIIPKVSADSLRIDVFQPEGNRERVPEESVVNLLRLDGLTP